MITTRMCITRESEDERREGHFSFVVLLNVRDRSEERTGEEKGRKEWTKMRGTE